MKKKTEQAEQHKRSMPTKVKEKSRVAEENQ